jgi:hypothetical protein
MRRYRWTVIYIICAVTLILILEIIDILGARP